MIDNFDTVPKKCIGCGIKKQNEFPNEVGYVKDLTHELCVRCHEIKNFNKLPSVSLNNEQFEKIIYEVGNSGKVVVWILDVFDLQGSYLEKIEKYLKNNKVILVGNKIDLIPKAISKRKLEEWFIDSIDADINVVEVIMTSSKSKKNIDDLVSLIKYYAKDEVYFIGATNTGKSSLINAIIKSLSPASKRQVTTSLYAGTTLSTINIPLTKKIKIIDTPGIVNDHQVTNYLSKESLVKVMPQVEINPINFQLNPEQTLFVSGLFRMDFLSGKRSTFTVYASKKIKIHRTKLLKADELFENHFNQELLAPPMIEDSINKDDYTYTDFTLPVGKHDLVLSGMGWICVKSDECVKVRIHHLKQVMVMVRKSII